MSTTPLKHDEAVEAFHRTLEATRALPVQPDRGLSEVRGTTWFLRNVQGPLARVNYEGRVRTGKIEE